MRPVYARMRQPCCVRPQNRAARGIQRRRRVAGPRWAVASSDNSRHSRICWNPGPSCLRLMFPGAGDGCPRCRRPALQSGLWRRLPFAGGALGQAEHVFLRGNGLPERWRGRDAFTVCETGFGLGLNFLALWRAWRDDPARSAVLHVLAVEGHPFALADLAALLARHAPAAGRPGARAGGPMAAAAAWLAPARVTAGRHADLAFGEAQTVAPRLDACVDAYFLDGFAPGRNPRMWEPALLRTGRHGAPGATLATWACTGELRRALSESGFDARRETGYGGKWHMTVATARAEGARAAQARARIRPRTPSWWARPGWRRHRSGLALRGWRVTVLDAARAGGVAAHAGHVAALTPVVARDDNARARLSRASARR